MSLVDLIIFLGAAWGFVYLVTEASILGPARVLLSARSGFVASLLYCAYCSGFWVGFVLAVDWLGLTWSWAAFDWRELIDGIWGGGLVMGSIAAMRAATDGGFLPSAMENESNVIKMLRDAKSRRDEDADGRDDERSA